jgi:SH3-like domain-containing protein
VQVVAETREWRKVCDPQGTSAWVHRRTTDGARSAFRAKPQPLELRSHPKADAGVRAFLAGNAVADLDKCEKGWCKVKVDGASGWAPARELWGVSEKAQCR